MLDLPVLALDLRTQIRDETERDEYWVVAPKGRGEFVSRQVGPTAPRTSQRDLAIRYMRELNQRCAYDGAWIVAWCDVAPRPHPLIVGLDVPIFTRLVSLWKDRDGDVVFTCDTEDMLRDLTKPGAVDVLVAQADEAYQAWRAIERDAGIGPQHKIKVAQGELARDMRVKAPQTI